ncbi:MAG: hypothetical protein WCR75_08785, partial [Sphaerochaetaceae bacterium]
CWRKEGKAISATRGMFRDVEDVKDLAKHPYIFTVLFGPKQAIYRFHNYRGCTESQGCLQMRCLSEVLS